MVRTDQSLVEQKAQSQLEGKACSTSKVLGHQGSVDARTAVRHELGFHKNGSVAKLKVRKSMDFTMARNGRRRG